MWRCKSPYLTQGSRIYKSNSQRARIATEAWGSIIFIARTASQPVWRLWLRTRPRLTLPVRIAMHCCTKGAVSFAGRPNGRCRLQQMVSAIQEDNALNLFALHYEPVAWKVVNLILIPHFAFPLSAIEKRKPLSANAERHGWVGCNIPLGAIPLDARTHVVSKGRPASPADVRVQYARIRPLEKIRAEQRGWTLDVLNVVRLLGKTEFSLRDVYAFEDHLARLHPANRHVRDKIRQQLQVLRDDVGLLEFLGGGEYRLR